MNYLRNLLRRLWPFVTRREYVEDMTKVTAVLAELDADIGRVKKLFHDILDRLYEVETPKKKPSRKKPAKKGKKK